MVDDELPSEPQRELRPILPERVVEPAAGSEAEDLALRPAEGPSREELSRHLEPPPAFAPPLPEPAGHAQFSIRDVMIVMIGVALGLAGGTWVRADVFAAFLGLVTLLGLVLVHLYPPESHTGKLLWATLVLAYDMTSPEAARGIATSKFRDVKGFADKIRTPILLQDHDTVVWFRNIKVREITAR